MNDSEEEVVVSSGEVIIVSHLPVSDNLVDKKGKKALCYVIIHTVNNPSKLAFTWKCLPLLVPQILDYGLWAAGALTAFGVCGLMVAVIMQRARLRPQPVPV